MFCPMVIEPASKDSTQTTEDEDNVKLGTDGALIQREEVSRAEKKRDESREDGAE